MAGAHPATDYEFAELRWFDHSGREIEKAFADNQDVLCNWVVVGVYPQGEQFRVYVAECSNDAVACIDGDGVHFGVASSPSSPEAWAEYLARSEGRT